jgi:hypothetical protein
MGAARLRAVLKTVIIFVARRRRTDWGKSLCLACWNADGVQGRKLELEHILSQNGVDIFLLINLFLNLVQTFRLANYVCRRTDRPTQGGGTDILVRCGILHHSVAVPGLTHLEVTVIQIAMVGKPVVSLAVYLRPPTHRLDASFGGGLPVLMAGKMNSKHVD